MTYDNISSQYQNYRRIALIVVHCSATRADRSFPVEALRRCMCRNADLPISAITSTSPATVSPMSAAR